MGFRAPITPARRRRGLPHCSHAHWAVSDGGARTRLLATVCLWTARALGPRLALGRRGGPLGGLRPLHPAPRCALCGALTMRAPAEGECPVCARFPAPRLGRPSGCPAPCPADDRVDRVQPGSGDDATADLAIDHLGSDILFTLVHATHRFAPRPHQMYDIPGTVDHAPRGWLPSCWAPGGTRRTTLPIRYTDILTQARRRAFAELPAPSAGSARLPSSGQLPSVI